MHFCDGRLAFEQFHFSLSVFVDNVVRCPATPSAKPFLKFWVPSDVVFHFDWQFSYWEDCRKR
jgi:hypothetical protein